MEKNSPMRRKLPYPGSVMIRYSKDFNSWYTVLVSYDLVMKEFVIQMFMYKRNISFQEACRVYESISVGQDEAVEQGDS